MNFTFTERHATIASRFVEVHIDKWLEKVEAFKKMDQNELKEKYNSLKDGYRYKMNGFSIDTRIDKHDCFVLQGLISFSCTYEDDDEEELESVEVDGLMLCLDHLSYKGTDIMNPHDHKLAEIYISTLEQAKQKLNTFVKTYQYCKCNNYLSVKDGWCEWCFPYITEQDDSCSVCLENTGLWVELKCKHKIHEHCFKKIENKKCPLCRKISDKILRL